MRDIHIGSGGLLLLAAAVLLPSPGRAATTAPLTPETTLALPGDGSYGDAFGYSLAADGDTLVVGRPERGSGGSDNLAQGSAYVYLRQGDAWVQQARLSAADGSARDEFGAAVALSGDTLLVAATRDDLPLRDQGSVHVFVRRNGQWTEQARIVSPTPVADEFFGSALALSGDTALIGSSTRGTAQVWVRSGTQWTQQAQLSAPAGAASAFGASVALQGDRAVVGAPADDGLWPDQGAAYVYRRSGTAWTLERRLDASLPSAGAGFGSALALSGDTLVVGATLDDGPLPDQGSASVFVEGLLGWLEQARLLAPEGASGDAFGSAVALSGDTVLVGARLADGRGRNNGAAQVFVRRAGLWSAQARLSDAAGADDDYFGAQVALAGEVAIVGAYRDDRALRDQGSVQLFARRGEQWSALASLSTPEGAAGDRLAYAVAVSGDTALLGAYLDDSYSRDQGSAAIFQREPAGWRLSTRLQLPGAVTLTENQRYGQAVALEGDTAAVAAPLERGGAVYLYRREGEAWGEPQRLVSPALQAGEQFGSALALAGDTLLVGAPKADLAAADQGAVYVYTRSAAGWVLQARLSAADGAAGDEFGRSVALEGDVALVGAPLDDGPLVDQGSAYMFVRSAGTWAQRSRLRPQDALAGDEFGYAAALSGRSALLGSYARGAAWVFEDGAQGWAPRERLSAGSNAGSRFGSALALSGDVAVIGASLDDAGSGATGAAYLYLRRAGAWQAQQRLVAADAATGDQAGAAVAVDGDTVLVGARADDTAYGRDAGSAGVYRIPSDHGDAPDTYATTQAYDGARHFIGGPRLGSAVDAEPDGQPNSGATGDDIAGSDDEDGLAFGPLVAGASASLDASVGGGPALLDAWVDFNGDGDFADAGERIFDHFIVLDGANAGLAFAVPADARAGSTYARVRLSSEGVDGPAGTAPDGEVEDQWVAIRPALPSISFGSASLRVDEGQGRVLISARLSAPQATTVRVPLRFGGSATAPADYRHAGSTLVFLPGQTDASLSLEIMDDALDEADETVDLLLRLPAGLAPGAVVEQKLLIVDDDAAPTVSFRVASQHVGEGGIAITVYAELSAPSAQWVRVPVSFGGTARVGTDYGRSGTRLSFAPGQLSAGITLNLVDDAVAEPTETVVLGLGQPSNAEPGLITASAVLIEDDD